ncbi:hypothetical protein VIGAN_09086200 [Vigna angularis var. angularis]|uniref:Cytochrome P450 n=1 Tax=Vigna angularis var. angularis TaxID=157739 RepID=A0A0S3SXC0_PHAAN|nr:hypothetical protein VIGAN_09086200 [Vigna angularis var. angularis]
MRCCAKHLSHLLNLDRQRLTSASMVLLYQKDGNMDPETYINPKEFDLSRWENHTARAGSFIPFGLGSRFCPGSDLTKLQLTIFLHHFLLNYRFHLFFTYFLFYFLS